MHLLRLWILPDLGRPCALDGGVGDLDGSEGGPCQEVGGGDEGKGPPCPASGMRNIVGAVFEHYTRVSQKACGGRLDILVSVERGEYYGMK